MSLAKKIILSVGLIALVNALGELFAKNVNFTHPDNLLMSALPMVVNVAFIFAIIFVWALGKETD
jgi:hypothetical protein